jgi:hypothetical protein
MQCLSQQIIVLQFQNTNTNPPKIPNLTVKSLNSIAIFSGGNTQAPDLNADKFFINVSSSGNLRMGYLQTSALTVNINISGDVTLGVFNAGLLEANIRSSGDLKIGGGEVKWKSLITSSQNFTSDISFHYI